MNTNLIETLALGNVVVDSKEPRHFEVVMLNDDYTPMEFVVSLLKEIFGMHKSKALQVMFQVHYGGQASCGFYSKKAAKVKVDAVKEQSQHQGFPLNCIIKRPISR